MHSLSSAFVLGYHGCDASVAEDLLHNAPFRQSDNDYDWLGSGIYFWEANPDRALDWAREVSGRRQREAKPSVVGAVIDLGFCLDLMSTNGVQAVDQAYREMVAMAATAGVVLPTNEGGDDRVLRRLDCAVVQYTHALREAQGEPGFDTVRGVFTEDKPLYTNSGFRRKTHIQICVRNAAMIKGVFRVPPHHFTAKL